jgi:hypothetical protein
VARGDGAEIGEERERAEVGGIGVDGVADDGGGQFVFR